MITFEKPIQTTAHIQSLDGAMGEITILGKLKDGVQPVYIVDYKGVKCTAIFNGINCTYYADDKYGRLQ